MKPIQTMLAVLSLSLVASACNQILGIHEGEPRGDGGAGGGGGPPSCSNDEPTVRWARTSASDAYTEAWAVAFTPEGDVVTAGVFAEGTFVLGDATVQNAGGGSYDIFLAKLDKSTGVPVWARAFPALAEQEIWTVAVDPVTGDIAVGGRFQGALDFGDGTQVLNEIGNVDAFIARFDKNGTCKWSKAWGNDSAQTVSAVAFDKEGALVVGLYGGGVITFEDGARGLAGDTSAFLAKLDAAGGAVWSRYFPTGYIDPGGVALAIGPSGEIVIAGETLSEANLSAPDPYYGGSDVFVASFDKNGTSMWSRIFGAGAAAPDQDGDQRAKAVAVDASGDVIVTGSFQNALDLDGSVLVNGLASDPGDLFLAKLSGANGDVLWAQRFYDAGLQEPRSVGVDAQRNITVAGILIDAPGSMGIDLGSCALLPPQEAENGTDYHEDFFIARYTPGGQHIFSKRIGDVFIQKGEAAVRPNGEVAVAGDFFFSISLDKTPKGQLADDGHELFVAVFDP